MYVWGRRVCVCVWVELPLQFTVKYRKYVSPQTLPYHSLTDRVKTDESINMTDSWLCETVMATFQILDLYLETKWYNNHKKYYYYYMQSNK